ncbi:MAG TPA: endopeptidase La [Ktedonobacteraceae bacterium]|nr:endopeptidase La [Ktedonobacteraceae bacterium]
MSEQERKETYQETQEADANYPLVALKNMVVFPRTRMTLAIAREKSMSAVEEAMMQPDHWLVVASQRDPDIDDPQSKDIYPVGTLVEITTMNRQQDGSLQVLFNGLYRVQINDYLDTEPYIRVSVNTPQEVSQEGPQVDAMVRHATSLFERYAQLNRRFSAEDITSIVSLKTAARLSDMLAAHLVTDAQQQQDLLETLDPLARLEKICVIMGNEIEILELESTIRSRVRSQVDRTQKEFYLREQLRAIQEELGMETTSEANELRDRANEKELPPEVETKLRKEIDRLERTPPQSAEIAVIRSYIDWILALPWTDRTEDIFDIARTREILDADHYGLDAIKERIIEFLAVRELRQKRASQDGHHRGESQGQILCLVGPPGVGKTSLGRSIAQSLGRKFARIALGGVHDEAEIRGHRRTYVGALPGRVIQSMKTVGVRNPVFLLDEIDKLSSEYRGDPSAALLEVLDSEQNNTFTDHYLEVPFDLSEVFFICTANVRYQIPRPLLDRMDVIELSGYMLEEKINIGMRHILPKVLAEHGLEPEQLKIPQSVMGLIVTGYTREAGVRNLERQIAAIARKVARRIIEKPNTHIRLTASNLEQYLGMPRFADTPLTQKQQVGVVIGLAVTEAGGVLLPVEVATMAGKGELIVTGQLGDVMRESAIAALSYIRSRAKELQIDPNFQDSMDLHIHMPENALPKDGPSAGITIATALISAITGRPVRPSTAMTGEITLRGRVLAIGGLREKVLAAHHANIHNMVIPLENKKDLAEIPPKIRQHMHFTIVDSMDQVIDAALLERPGAVDGRLEKRLPTATRPVAMDEHRVSRHKHDQQGVLPGQHERDEEDDNEQELIIPPPEQQPGETYPQAKAWRQQTK